jgi:hypothetical protein
MCGTAAEVTPVCEVDDIEIGVGALTRELQKAYDDAVRGRSERWRGWRDYVAGLTEPAEVVDLAGWPEVDPPPESSDPS